MGRGFRHPKTQQERRAAVSLRQEARELKRDGVSLKGPRRGERSLPSEHDDIIPRFQRSWKTRRYCRYAFA